MLPVRAERHTGDELILMADKGGDKVARVGIPDADEPVKRCSRDVLSVLAQRGSLDPLIRARETVHRLSGMNVSCDHIAVAGYGEDVFAIGREQCAVFFVRVSGLQDRERRTGLNIPQARRLIRGCRKDQLTVGAEPGAADLIRMPNEYLRGRAGLRVPNPRGFVRRGCHDEEPVGAERGGSHYISVAGEYPDGLSRPGVPDAGGLVARRRNDLVTPGTESRGPYASCMPLKDELRRAARRVPNAGRVV
jgi:hypothetical protein